MSTNQGRTEDRTEDPAEGHEDQRGEQADLPTGGGAGRSVEMDIAFPRLVDGDMVDGDVIDGDEEAIARLDAAAHALDDVDVADWSDTALSGQIDRLSLVLCRVDAQVSRLADAVRSRGFAIREVELPLAS